MNKQNQFSGAALVKNTLDAIPTPAPDARRITALVKQGGRVTGYQLSDNSILPRQDCVNLARQGGIQGVAIAHRKSTEYLKSVPDGEENNNLSALPSIVPPGGNFG